MIRHFFKLPSCHRIAPALVCLAFGSTIWIAAQRRNPLLAPTGFDDVVFAISFSPDGKTLAIARGAAEPSQRFGRIELWDAESGKLRHVIKGFDGPVKSISFSPDGQTLLSGSLEYRSTKIQEKTRAREGEVYGELKWWDGQTGELKNKVRMPGEGNSNLRVTYSPDGKDVAVAESFVEFSFLSFNPTFQPPSLSNPGTPFPLTSRYPTMFLSADMKLLDAHTGELKLKVSTNNAGALTYSPDGSLLAIAHGDEVKLWDGQTGKEDRKLKGFKGKPNAIAFSPDGRIMAIASTKYNREDAGRFLKIIGKSEIKLYDVNTWKEIRKVSDVGAVNTIAFNPNGKVLIIGGVMQQGEKNIAGVLLLDLPSGKLDNLPIGEDFTEAVDSLAVTDNGRLLALRAGPLSVKILETETWTVKQTLDAHSVGSDIERPVSRFILSVKRILAIAFSQDGTLAGETDQGEFKLWDPRTGEVKKQLSGDHNAPSLVAVSANGKSFAEINDGKLRVWNADDSAKRLVPMSDNRNISAIAVSTTGKTLALGSDHDIRLINSAGAAGKTLISQQGPVNSLVFSGDDRVLASAGENGTIEIWDLANSRIEKTFATGAQVTALRFAPNSQDLAIASADRSITIWNWQSGLVRPKLQKHEAPINALAFSPDGQLLASGGDDRNVVIWETATGKSKRTLKGHDQTVTSLAFSPDGRLLASGSGNAAIVLWEVRSGKFSRVLK